MSLSVWSQVCKGVGKGCTTDRWHWVWRSGYDEVTAALHHEEFEVFELKCVLSTMFLDFASCPSLSLSAFPSAKFIRNCPSFLICISSLPSGTLCLVGNPFFDESFLEVA